MLKVDFHTHSIASGHALNTIDELLRQADRNGIEGMAITDHSPGIDNTVWLAQNQPDGEIWQHVIKGPDIPYFTTLLARYRQPADANAVLFKGIECNILGAGPLPTDVPRFIAKHFDVVVASIHPLPAIFKVESSEQITARMILAMDDPIDIIGHPYHQNYSPYMEPVVQAAADKGITLEMNNSSLQLGKADLEQVMLMLVLASRMDCRISLASDAHMTNELGDDDKIRQLLAEVDFPQELIVNHSLQAAREFIATRKQVRQEITG